MALSKAQVNAGAFLPTTNIWDPSEIEEIDVNSKEFKELMVKLYRNINNIALSVNIRDAGYYDLTEFINGQLFFPNPSLSSLTPQAPTYRQVFRKIINFGALPSSSTKIVPHEIDTTVNISFTRIYGTSTDPTNKEFCPIPFASKTINESISLLINATNIEITTNQNRSSFTTTYVILEYIKN